MPTSPLIKMSAQYRPYRDEEGLEGDNLNWSDQEPGTVQIYEKAADETCSVSTRTLIVGGIGIALLGALLGLLIGYFAHYEHSNCVPSLAVALNSVRDEDVTIRGKILEMVDAERIKQNIRKFSSHPHIAGSKSDYDLAEVVKNMFQDHGLDKVNFADYSALLSYPDCDHPNKVSIVDNDEKDVHVIQNKSCDMGIAPYSAYAQKGKIIGDLVYVNYGRSADFDSLEDMVDLKGKILIAKNYFPAKQAWDASQKGAKGLLLYPDPNDYNPPFLNSTPYPDSWWLPGDATIKDSILWNGIGDPQTTDYPAIKRVQRLEPPEAIFPHIRVQPISYNEAYQLLKLLGGNTAPETWKGGFNFTLRVGPGFTNGSLKTLIEVNNKNMNKTVRNVFGYIKGKVEADRYVLIGSHRDAWVHGAIDSASGTAALLEISYVFGQLLKKGWRPRRTIIFCNWGAEEFNLMGSTEWLEENFKVLHGRTVAYINIDTVVIGNVSLNVAASPLLYHAIYNATKEVNNPNKDEMWNTVYDVWRVTYPHDRNTSRLIFPEHVTGDDSFLDYDEHFLLDPEPDATRELLDNYIKSSMLKVRPRIQPLNGRGSYATFTRAGIPSVDLSYVHDTRPLQARYPLYHTEYDVFEAIEKYIDPTFKYYGAVVQILGELLRDLSDSLFLPFNLFDYAQFLYDFYLELQTDSLLKQELDFSILNASISNFTNAALKFHTAQESSDLSDPMIIRRINDQLLLLERAFLDPSGFSRYLLKRHLVPSHGDTSFDETFPAVINQFTKLVHQKDEVRSDDIRVLYSFLVLTIQSATATIQEVV